MHCSNHSPSAARDCVCSANVAFHMLTAGENNYCEWKRDSDLIFNASILLHCNQYYCCFPPKKNVKHRTVRKQAMTTLSKLGATSFSPEDFNAS